MSYAADVLNSAHLELHGGGDAELRRPFDPTAHDLDGSFRLTRFADLKGRGCKVPQDVLSKLVSALQQDYSAQDQEPQFLNVAIPRIGIGLDCSVIPLRHGGLCLVQTTDFFYPIVDDPYMMGKIACANVLSDLYAMGVTDCDNMLMLLAVSTKMTAQRVLTVSHGRSNTCTRPTMGSKIKGVLISSKDSFYHINSNLKRWELDI